MKTNVKNLISKVSKNWNQFWFGPKDLFALSVFRILICGGGFIFYLFRHLDYRFLLSNEGILPFTTHLLIKPPGAYSPIQWDFLARSTSIGMSLHLLFLVLLLGIALGLIGRIGIWAAFILNLVFASRNVLAVYGSDQVFSIWLLYLSFTRCNDYLSLRWPWEKKPKLTRQPNLVDDIGSSVGIRLIQIQLCIIYMYSGLEKAKGNTWWQGDAIWNIFANGQLVSINFSFASDFPILLTAMTFSVVLWEVYFPALIWNRKLRPYVLLIGVSMHLGIALIMHLPFFALFMIAPYLFFLEPEKLRACFRRT